MRKLILQMSVSLDGVVATPKDAGALNPGGEDPGIKQLKREPGGDIIAWGGAG